MQSTHLLFLVALFIHCGFLLNTHALPYTSETTLTPLRASAGLVGAVEVEDPRSTTTDNDTDDPRYPATGVVGRVVVAPGTASVVVDPDYSVVLTDPDVVRQWTRDPDALRTRSVDPDVYTVVTDPDAYTLRETDPEVVRTRRSGDPDVYITHETDPDVYITRETDPDAYITLTAGPGVVV